jgi:hypothetical protein
MLVQPVRKTNARTDRRSESLLIVRKFVLASGSEPQ